MNLDTIYFLIAVIGCIVGVAGWIRSLKRESISSAFELQKLNTQVQHLLEESSALKTELKGIQEDITNILSLSMDAKATASAAHDRLDALGATSAHQSREEKNKISSGNLE